MATAKLASAMLRSRLTLVHELSQVYKPTIKRNTEKVMELMKEKADRASKSELARKMKILKGFYTLEMSPPSTAQEMAMVKEHLKLAFDFFKSGAYMQMTVKQAWLMFLVGLEIGLWFYIGETVGKFKIVGYGV